LALLFVQQIEELLLLRVAVCQCLLQGGTFTLQDIEQPFKVCLVVQRFWRTGRQSCTSSYLVSYTITWRT
jgi:hypothetical protein